jgi:outer membrane immunogenic protein
VTVESESLLLLGHTFSTINQLVIAQLLAAGGGAGSWERSGVVMKRFLIVGAIAFAAGQAFAADLPQPAAVPQAPAAYVPAAPPVYDWGGIYVGINGGWGFGKSDWTNTGTGASTGNFDTSGGVVGGTLGFNYQIQQFVLGVEGDIDWADNNGSSSSGPCAGLACTTKNTWLGTIRGRAGYAVDRVLFYGTAGGAYGEIQQSGAGLTTGDFNRFGWTAGAGVEAAFTDNITGRIEYLYADLGSGSCSVVCFTGASTNVSFSTSLVRAGVDFKFR